MFVLRFRHIAALLLAFLSHHPAEALDDYPVKATQARQAASHSEPEADVSIETLSSSPQRISGGDVLVRISHAKSGSSHAFSITLNGSDVTDRFQKIDRGTASLGLVDGLRSGVNELEVIYPHGPHRSLQLVNYPIQGPIVSGPHLRPFVCQTESFLLPDGRTLGKPLDENCFAKTQISYVYMSTATGEFKPLPNPKQLPNDIATTKISTGASVKFIARVETATIDRGIFQSAILHDPSSEPDLQPTAPSKGWNRVLIAVQGFGCPGGWYVQNGRREGAPKLLDARRLAQGYALYTNTLQNPSVSCNAFLAGEAAMMGKEYFIERYGVPNYTVSTGVSGGAYTTLQVIDAFPGLYQGAIVGAVFPDVLSIAISGMDARLLQHYFKGENTAALTESQMVAVSGYQGESAWFDAANQAGRTDPVPMRSDVPRYTSGVWKETVPAKLRYDPRNNPLGARPTIWDLSKNIYGVDAQSGFALRVFDNVGIQYGLAALNSGIITTAQFLDLNAKIGGYDRDDNFIPTRVPGDLSAISEAYRSGLQLSGGGGLADVPILDVNAGLDKGANETDHYHYQWFRFSVRQRLIEANGDADNYVMWRRSARVEGTEAVEQRGFQAMMNWLAAIHSDSSAAPMRDKVRRHKPSGLVDGCWNANLEFIAEKQSFDRLPSTRCNALIPSYAFPRYVAGSGVAANTLKCALKPVDERQYRVSFSREELERLRKIFPQGVCDWSVPGAEFSKVIVGRSYGPAPSLTKDGRR